MITSADVGYSISVAPERAIAFLEARQARVTGPWTEWLDGQHARGFTVANVAKLDVLDEIKQSLARALRDGQTLEQWKAGLTPELQRKGWMGRDYTTQQLRDAGRVDEATGEIRKGLAASRLKTIFATNMQSAYMAGRHDEMMEQAEDRPYWQYVAILDARTRPAHRAMNGRIFRYDDPGWRSFYPPCGYRCRCRVRNFSRAEVTRRKLPISSTDGKLSEVDVPLRNGAVAKVTRYTDPSLPGGRWQPDVGFSSNPGQATWQPRLEARDVPLSRRYVDTTVQGPAFERMAAGKDAASFPVGVMTPARQAQLGADSGVAYLDAATVAAGQRAARRGRPGLDDYRRIPEVIDQGAVEPQLDGTTTLTWSDLRLVLDLAADGGPSVLSLTRIAP